MSQQEKHPTKKPRKIPLASGLVGRESRSILGQPDVSLISCNIFHTAVWRIDYSGLSNVTFSIPGTDLQEIVDLLKQARKKADTYPPAGAAVESFGEKGETKKKLPPGAIPA